jgi:hypothetical protein
MLLIDSDIPFVKQALDKLEKKAMIFQGMSLSAFAERLIASQQHPLFLLFLDFFFFFFPSTTIAGAAYVVGVGPVCTKEYAEGSILGMVYWIGCGG